MDHAQVQGWLDRYVEAWRTYDAGAIGDLFAAGAEYRYHPWGAPVRGRDAIVAAWVDPQGTASGRDEPGTYDARYEPYAVDGDRAVAIGWSRYWTDASRSQERATYRNCFVLAFDEAGRCTSFTEFFMQEPTGTGS